jgi:hypothetical protein
MGFLRVSAPPRENQLLVLRSHKDRSLAEHAENAEKKRRFKRFPSRLRVFARGPAFVVLPTEIEPMSLAKPRSRKGGQEWVSSASQRLREKIGFWCFEATKTVLSQSTRRTQRRKAHQSVFLAPSRLCERTGFCRTSDRNRTHVSRKAAKPQRRAGMGFLRVSASPRENRVLVLRSHKDRSLAEHAENAETKSPSIGFLRAFARGPAFVVAPLRKETHVSRQAAKPQRRAGMGFLRDSASPRENRVLVLRSHKDRSLAEHAENAETKSPSIGFLRAFASWRETWVFFLLKKPKGRSSRQDAKTRREAFEALFPLRALRENDTCRLSQPRAV